MSNPSGAVRRGVAAALSILATIFLAHTASAQAQSPTEVRDGYYRAAERVDVPGPVQGDVIAAGRDVVIGHDVTGDVIAAGRTVALRATAHDDVRVAGGEVTLDAPIAGDITAAGRSIVIGPSARVTGRTWVSGGTVTVVVSTVILDLDSVGGGGTRTPPVGLGADIVLTKSLMVGGWARMASASLRTA